MKAVILAAGQGHRLRPLTDSYPKALVPVRGRPIIDQAIESLRAGGITQVSVVGGWKWETLERLQIPIHVNPRYDRTNMVASLMCARDWIAGDDVLVVYGDILFHPRAVRALVAETADVAIAVNTQWRDLWQARMADPLADAETLVIDSAGNVTEIGKRPTSYDQVQGQYMGLIRFSREAVARVLGFYDRMDRSVLYDGKDFDNMYMTSFLQAIADQLEPVRAVLVDGGWMEVDSHEDLEVAERRGSEFLA
jgi:choline kinase